MAPAARAIPEASRSWQGGSRGEGREEGEERGREEGEREGGGGGEKEKFEKKNRKKIETVKICLLPTQWKRNL